jgi:hypothetical protein
LENVDVLRRAVQICEIAPAAAGDENLAAGLPVVFEKRHATAALAGHSGTHQASRARAQDNYIELARRSGHGSVKLS